MRAYPFGQRSVETVAFYGLLSDLEAQVETQWSDEYESGWRATIVGDSAHDESWYERQA
jgi:hypothetical protein